VNDCTEKFSKTGTWYRHVIHNHYGEYSGGGASSEVARDEDMEV
jgi:hypothetical protein